MVWRNMFEGFQTDATLLKQDHIGIYMYSYYNDTKSHICTWNKATVVTSVYIFITEHLLNIF